jgi:hypothetical protein
MSTVVMPAIELRSLLAFLILAALAVLVLVGRRLHRRAENSSRSRAGIDEARRAWVALARGWYASGQGESLKHANLAGARLGDVCLRGADLGAADLRGAVLDRAELSDANLSGAILAGAHLSGAHLIGADLTSADLSDAMLCGTDLVQARLRGADLDHADLRDAFLISTDFRDARGLEHANLAGARYSDSTHWPDAFDLPAGLIKWNAA